MDAMGADVQLGPGRGTADVMVRADMMERVVDMRVERTQAGRYGRGAR